MRSSSERIGNPYTDDEGHINISVHTNANAVLLRNSHSGPTDSWSDRFISDVRDLVWAESPFHFDEEGLACIIGEESSHDGAGQIVELYLKLTSDPGRN